MIVGVMEWTGAVFGLLGAFLMATNTIYSKFGWLAFMVANIALIGFAIKSKHHGLLLQQLGFLGTSVLGIYRSGLF